MSSEEQGGDGQLKKKAVRGSVLELSAYASTYIIRFVSSTWLRAILFPAAFGVMEVVNGITLGLVMLSDVGVQQAVIQSKRGDERVFLDTAWTIHVVRGVILWFISVLLSYPIALFTEQPSLTSYIPVCTLSIVILGFRSSAEFTLRRRMSLGRIAVVEVTAQIVAASVMLIWAHLHPSVWALVVGSITGAVVRTAMSYWLANFVGHFNRFCWDKGVRDEIYQFGKWIMASSAVFFVSTWSDRIMFVGLLGATNAGVYSTAVLISESIGGALDKVIHGVFYPLFSKVGRDGGAAELRRVYYAARLRFDAMSLGGTGILAAMGPWIITLLYDSRYEDAGWMLRALCLRSATLAIAAPCETALFALGHTRYGFFQNLARATWLLVTVPAGYALFGAAGVVYAVAVSAIPQLFITWPKFRQLGILRIERELFAVGLFIAGLCVGTALLFVLPEATAVRSMLKELLAG